MCLHTKSRMKQATKRWNKYSLTFALPVNSAQIVAICASPALHICASSPIPKLLNPSASLKVPDWPCYLPRGKIQMIPFQQLHISLAITYIPFQCIGCWKFSNTWRLHAQRFLLWFSERPNKPTMLIRFCSCGHRTSSQLCLITRANSCHESFSNKTPCFDTLGTHRSQHLPDVLQIVEKLQA